MSTLRRGGFTLLAAALVVSSAALTTPAQAQPSDGSPWVLSPEVSETSRLADRRSLVSGDRMYAMGDTSGLYPAAGWHIRGEMGGFWTQPIKLLDGMWFRVGNSWLGDKAATTSYSRGFGYERYTYEDVQGIRVNRVDFVPDGVRAAVVGIEGCHGPRR